MNKMIQNQDQYKRDKFDKRFKNISKYLVIKKTSDLFVVCRKQSNGFLREVSSREKSRYVVTKIAKFLSVPKA